MLASPQANKRTVRPNRDESHDHTQHLPCETERNMTESSAQPSSTPNRRRQGRNGGRAAAQKGYVSENDVGGVDASRYNNTTLQTPEKRSAGSPAANNVRVGSGRHRIKNKADKQKNAGSSPEFDRPAQSTTPQRPASVKAPNSIAFAGATFHASPAPSALPMPSFFKITGTSPGSKDPQGTAQQPSPPVTDANIRTPQRHSVGAKASDSPLDFMFRAHREEKQRQNQGQNPVTDHNPTPPADPYFRVGSFPKASPVSQPRPIPTRQPSSGGIDDGELGPNYDEPVGPAFSTPYHDRIMATRSTNSRPSPAKNNDQQQWGTHSSEDPTEALKRALFKDLNRSPSALSPPVPPSRNGISESPSAPRGHEVSRNAYQGSNFQAMENDLRRILKLDANPSTSSPEHPLFTK